MTQYRVKYRLHGVEYAIVVAAETGTQARVVCRHNFPGCEILSVEFVEPRHQPRRAAVPKPIETLTPATDDELKRFSAGMRALRERLAAS